MKFIRFTGTKDPLEKEKIEEDPDMEDIFRPPEPFNTTVPGKDKNATSKFVCFSIKNNSSLFTNLLLISSY